MDRSISSYKIAVPIRFLDSMKRFCAFVLCLSDSDAQYINTIITDMQGNIRIDRLTLGRGADRGTDIYLDPWN